MCARGVGPHAGVSACRAAQGHGYLVGLDKRKLAKAFPEFTESMRALKARAGMKRVVVIGGDE